ncbi:hypothetical protein VNO77_14788 [Canavalia gladiata]|uniref:Uncharacterized protein n=1 Tax=Canavalia gladiata TaxID=3824 RepID=A0AAN9QQX8_CANGL
MRAMSLPSHGVHASKPRAVYLGYFSRAVRAAGRVYLSQSGFPSPSWPRLQNLATVPDWWSKGVGVTFWWLSSPSLAHPRLAYVRSSVRESFFDSFCDCFLFALAYFREM